MDDSIPSTTGRAYCDDPAPTGANVMLLEHPPPGRPGHLLAARPRGVTARGAAIHTVDYQMTGVDGRIVRATGIAFVPPGAPPADGWRIVTGGHGAVGTADRCAPSRVGGTPENAIGDVDLLVAAGFAVILPDYEGLGGDGPHPYMHGLSAGRSLLDGARCLAGLTSVSSRVAAWGFSQGGHAAGWAGELAANGLYGADLDVVAVCLEPAVPAEFASDHHRDWGYAYCVLMTYGMWIGSGRALPLQDVVHDHAATRFDAIDQHCVADTQAAFAASDFRTDPTRASDAWATAFNASTQGFHEMGRCLHFEAGRGIGSQRSLARRGASFRGYEHRRMRRARHDTAFVRACQPDCLRWVNRQLPE